MAAIQQSFELSTESFQKPFSYMEYIAGFILLIQIIHSDMGVHCVNVPYGFMQTWLDHFRNSHNANLYLPVVVHAMAFTFMHRGACLKGA